jgi:predicted DNA-binding protein
MTPVSKTFTFAIPDDLKAGLQAVKERDGLSEAEQIRRAIAAWLSTRGVVKVGRKRASTRKRP